MKLYDAHDEWDDPFERPPERRQSQRLRRALEASIARNSGGPWHPARIVNLSAQGLLMASPVLLYPSQSLHVRLLTDAIPADVFLPAELEGAAEVCRVEDAGEGACLVALRLGPDFTQSMDYGIFLRQLELLSHVV